MAEKVDYHLWEMVERVANLFRIYPTERQFPFQSSRIPKPQAAHCQSLCLKALTQLPAGLVWEY